MRKSCRRSNAGHPNCHCEGNLLPVAISGVGGVGGKFPPPGGGCPGGVGEECGSGTAVVLICWCILPLADIAVPHPASLCSATFPPGDGI